MNRLCRSMLEIVLMAMIIFIIPATTFSGEKIDIRYLVKGKKVIPVTYRIGHWEITDIKLPDLVVTNKEKTAITIYQAEVIGKVSGVERTRLQIYRKELSEAIALTADMLNKQKPPLATVQLSLGNVALPEGILSENGRATKGQSIVLPLSKIAYLHYVGKEKIDGMEIKLTIKSGRQKMLASIPVQLTFYEAKGKYTFPVKGDVQMAFLPLSYIHHRGSASQEFAMDVVGANQKEATSFTEISSPKPKSLSDYSIWGREVVAIGDGVVLEVGDKFPEEPMSDPAQFTKQGYSLSLIKELAPKIGWTNAIAGNYIVIDHKNGEYSAYCHLQEGSIGVKAGDSVHKGMVIAKVGNTGNSGAPHLHFQLMDSQDFFTANGLPVMFEDVPAQVMIAGFPVKGNTLSFSDSIFYTVP